MTLSSTDIMLTLEFDDTESFRFDLESNVEFVCEVNNFTMVTDITQISYNVFETATYNFNQFEILPTICANYFYADSYFL